MCRFVVQIKKATLNGSDGLFNVTFVMGAPVSEVAWDCSSQFASNPFILFEIDFYSLSSPQFVKLLNRRINKVKNKQEEKTLNRLLPHLLPLG